ncbi:hypothetical protein [Streptomyces mirabilis]
MNTSTHIDIDIGSASTSARLRHRLGFDIGSDGQELTPHLDG